MASQEEAAFWRRYRSWDGQETLKTQLERKDGQWLHFSVHRSQDGSVDVVTVRSITEEHQREEEYQMRLQQAEAASQFKTSFFFRMSHEIRTPMNGITGMLTLIRSKLAPDHPAMQYVDRAGELSDHLLSLINDILDMSHIEAGKVELEANPFSLHAFGNKLYDMFGKTLDSKGVRFDVTFDSVTEDWVVGDELRIGQVVINFLSNALKFTSRGEVTVTFRQMMLRENAVDLMIRIHDTGIGMAPEFISRIFRPFEQEDTSTTRRFGGTGLGMAISDQLVKLMGGQIVVESLPESSSDFTVFLSLPVMEAPAGAAAAEAAPVETAAQPASYYDLILMDIQMPVMDGRTAARTIRGLARPDAADIPIYALSADAFAEDERLSRENGMNGHLTKPIDFDALWQIAQDIENRKETAKR